MRVLICDDDAHIRTVLRGIVTQRGYEVVGEADAASDAYALFARVKPDAAIVDLALRMGSGRDFARDASARGCRVIVFSAFLDDIDANSLGVVGILKPNFEALESALDALAVTRTDSGQWRAGQADRRAIPVAADRVTPVGAVEEANDFYRALGEAHPGDTLLILDADSDGAAETLTTTMRAVIRTHDHLMRRGTQLVVLLVDGLPTAAEAVVARLERASAGGTWRARHALLTEEEIPADTYSRLRSQG